MAQIPGLPIDEPVTKPQASPAQFGSAGASIAGLGEQTEQMAAASSQVEGHLIRAQRQLKAKEAQIAFDRMKNQVYQNLSNAVTSEDAQAVYDHSKGELDNVLAPFETDRVLSRELGLYRQQEDVEIQGTVNARKATIITKSDAAANQVLGEKAIQEAINTKVGGGDPSIPRARFDMQLKSSVAHGTLLPEQAESQMQKWDRDFQEGVVDAYANSADPSKRKELIAQLGGGKGEPDLSALDAGEVARLRTHAIAVDHSLSAKEESEGLNGALNVTHNAFQAPQYAGNYDLQLQALDDDKWLKDHNIVTREGEPDRIMAEKLAADVNRQREYHERAQREKDEGVLEKYSPMIDEHKLTIPKIDQLMQTEHASARAVATLKSQWHQEQRNARAEWHFDQAEKRAAKQDARQDLEDRGLETSANLWQRISNGEVLDLTSDIYEQKGKNLTSQQATALVEGYKKSKQYTDFANGLGIIDHSPGLDNSMKAKLADQFTNKVKQENIKPEDMPAAAQSLVDEASHKAVGGFIDNLWKKMTSKPSLDDKGLPVVKAETPKAKPEPKRPASVPSEAVWNSGTGTWQLPR